MAELYDASDEVDEDEEHYTYCHDCQAYIPEWEEGYDYGECIECGSQDIDTY